MAGWKLDAQIRITGVQITCAEDPLTNDLAVGGKVDEVLDHYRNQPPFGEDFELGRRYRSGL